MKFEKKEINCLELSNDEVIDFNNFYCELSGDYLEKYDRIIEKIYNLLPVTDDLEQS